MQAVTTLLCIGLLRSFVSPYCPRPLVHASDDGAHCKLLPQRGLECVSRLYVIRQLRDIGRAADDMIPLCGTVHAVCLQLRCPAYTVLHIISSSANPWIRTVDESMQCIRATDAEFLHGDTFTRAEKSSHEYKGYKLHPNTVTPCTHAPLYLWGCRHGGAVRRNQPSDHL